MSQNAIINTIKYYIINIKRKCLYPHSQLIPAKMAALPICKLL